MWYKISHDIELQNQRCTLNHQELRHGLNNQNLLYLTKWPILCVLCPNFLHLLAEHVGQIVAVSGPSTLGQEPLGLQVIFGEVGSGDGQAMKSAWHRFVAGIEGLEPNHSSCCIYHFCVQVQIYAVTAVIGNTQSDVRCRLSWRWSNRHFDLSLEK